MKIFKYDIRFNTFFKKGLPKLDDRFGVWLISGRQGTGKNYLSIYLTTRQSTKMCNYIMTNVHSLKIPGFEMRYFTKITEIYENYDEHVIFIIDEVSKKWDKSSKTDKDFYAWLNQCRKRKRICMLITQEYRELPMWIRRPIKFNFVTRPTKILNIFGIYTSIVGDAENLVFDKDEGEYTCPTIKYIIYKRNKLIADMYDTFEPIETL